MQEKIIEITSNGLQESFTLGKVARQTDGSVLYRQGKTMILATVVSSDKAVHEPFLPLTVQYIEKAYAAAKIPGGFVKRESKPSDFETLTSRIIDRSLRPLFPEDFAYPTVITVLVLSADSEVDLQVAALHAANAALLVSDLPVERSVAAVRLGKIDGERRLNPPLSRMEESALDLLLVGSGEELLMIEMAAKATEVIEVEEIPEPELLMGPMPVLLPHQESNELPEEELIALIGEARGEIAEACRRYEEALRPFKAEIREFPPVIDRAELEDLTALVREQFSDRIASALAGLSKSERADIIDEVVQEVEAYLVEHGIHREPLVVYRAIEAVKREMLRRQILEEGVRPDGRKPDEVRPISIETNLLPSVHGSCLFTRGETQALATVTLGEGKEGQLYELLTERSPRTERFMVHYNFPPFCVGEARPIGAPSRRELGHGNLAKRALEPVIDRELSRTIRLVSEILESNGSSSMATVCAGSLALVSAEAEISALVAGVAMGLVKEGDRHRVLTDIMGLEDHDGDMDFKVAGTRKGITAMQLDIKLGGLDLEILSEALTQAKKARFHILDLMEEAQKSIVPSAALPVAEHFHIDPSKIVHVIGKAGSTIREIIEKFEVKIDMDREKGKVKVTGADREKVKAAREHIEGIASREEPKVPKYEVGATYQGTVKRIADYGLFVELPGADTMRCSIAPKCRAKALQISNRVMRSKSRYSVSRIARWSWLFPNIRVER
ncbi:polyribonucleotide nucleotidyltransferase [Nitratifractor salsuginis DSM 16511]|uniref:Polyribonucleotide nucleotidyltransferase n=1 Tax=Nitratifractor salsuginis (strain DSM 16511 / JCM 12458 / E9I37-1) TaxID=749222 RepID=E6X0E1_NITSE|nr:polyribonucleotide nucleotidyltransferase [Nitratifractor salsuginis DSM 16511]